MTLKIANNPRTGKLTIIPYEDSYLQAFARLNREWHEEFGLIEDADRKHLNAPRESIIEPGGQIFLVVENGIVGNMGTFVVDNLLKVRCLNPLQRARIDAPSVLHHIVMRRIERKAIFKEGWDQFYHSFYPAGKPEDFRS